MQNSIPYYSNKGDYLGHVLARNIESVSVSYTGYSKAKGDKGVEMHQYAVSVCMVSGREYIVQLVDNIDKDIASTEAQAYLQSIVDIANECYNNLNS